MISLQDVDCLYLTKEELEVRVGLLRQQLEFLKCIYAEVRAAHPLPQALRAKPTQGKVSSPKILQPQPNKSLSLYLYLVMTLLDALVVCHTAGCKENAWKKAPQTCIQTMTGSH